MMNNEPFSPLRSLITAISSGKLDRSDLVENRQEILMEILDCDSADLIELIMETENRSQMGNITVGNLVDNFPDEGLDDTDFHPVAK
jgi:acyl carrier protein